jgi:type I restriction enzyme S subunit
VAFIRAADLDSGRVLFESASRINETARNRVRKGIGAGGDVLLSHKGTVGKVAYVPLDAEPFVCSPQTTFWRSLDQKRIDRRYLYYYLCSDHFRRQLDSRKGESDMADYVSLTVQRSLHILLPPIGEQRAIAAVLGSLDDKAEVNRRMNRTLEAMARALFRSWFVDFDPVRARADGRPPAGMDAETAALFPDHFEDSEAGKIPTGWKVARLEEVAEARKGLSYKGSGLADDGMPMHNLNSVHEGGGYKYEGIKYYTGEYDGRHEIRPGELIVANTEQGFDYLLIGYPAIVPRCFGEVGIFSHHIYRVRPRPKSGVTTRWLYHLLMSDAVRDVVTGYTNGTTVNMLAVEGLQKPLFVLPPPELVQAFERIAVPMAERAERNREESATLAQLRDTLLPKLISGELRVPDAEHLVRRAK